LANVAPSTVSLVINGDHRVADETRSRVKAILEEQGYRPRRAGRPRTARPSINVGVVIGDAMRVEDGVGELARDWVQSIRDALSDAGGHMSLFAGGQPVDQDVLFGDMLASRQLDGVILAGVTPKDEFLRDLFEKQVPVVAMNRRPANVPFSYVEIDGYGAARHVAAHLSEQGHQRVAVIQSSIGVDFGRPRIQGARDAFPDVDMTLTAERSIHPAADPADYEQCCREVLESGATAIYATSHSVCLQVINALDRMGIDVPRQFSVVGFDDLHTCASNGLRPTSIGYDRELMGREATRMLTELIRTSCPFTAMSMTVGTYLAEHDTTSSPAA